MFGTHINVCNYKEQNLVSSPRHHIKREGFPNPLFLFQPGA